VSTTCQRRNKKGTHDYRKCLKLWAGDAGFEPVTFGAGVKENGFLEILQLTENKQKILT
jgi:hypothetical protein